MAQLMALPTTGTRGPLGHSEGIVHVRELIDQVAHHNTLVLIQGESGSGKEVVARAIHDASDRRSRPFVPVNCGAIPADLLESELFGHEKGAFTGAINTRKGRFEMAEGGTLFLDEIGDMSLPMQVKLLRVLQEKCFERVGSNQTIQSNVRVLAATHRDLEAMVDAGTFRQDLYFRLNVFPIMVPALRERLSDLDMLIRHFCRKQESRGEQPPEFPADVIDVLRQHPWPGNIRELENLIERMTITHGGKVLSVDDLPLKYLPEPAQQQRLQANQQASQKAIEQLLAVVEVPEPEPTIPIIDDVALHEDWNERLAEQSLMFGASVPVDTPATTWLVDLPPDGVDLKSLLRQMEVHLIEQALERAQGVVSQAAKLLSLQRTTLVEKMKKLGLTSVAEG